MDNLTMYDIINADFKLYDNNPVLKPFDGSFVVADPSLLTPETAHDKKWHMFFHTHFGVYHFESPDGIKWVKVKKLLNRAMRPDINYADGVYYLFYERIPPLLMSGLNFLNLCKWNSEIYVIESRDLIFWSKPKKVIGHTKTYENCDRGGVSISNPFFLHEGKSMRLYYSAGLTYIEDCHFCEPTHISYAESNCFDSGYVSADEPIISPDKNDPHLNLCSGCLKVYRVKDGYIGVQNGIYKEDGVSKSGIMLLSSADGKSFKYEKMLLEPQMCGNKTWMKQYVYASHLVKYNNTLRLYFNARDISDPLKGRECIGFCEAEI